MPIITIKAGSINCIYVADKHRERVSCHSHYDVMIVQYNSDSCHFR